jgi:HJR/Mrr/RecB family endonuclease
LTIWFTLDGITIFNDIAQSIESDSSAIYWNIDLVDNVTGNAFEKIIANLYSLMYEGYTVKRTSHNNDNGVDIVVISETTKNGFLIKCRHKENFAEKLDEQTIQEIHSSKIAYESDYLGIKFQMVIVTNVENFTADAINEALDKKVKIIVRNELKNMLIKYKVLKF